MNDPRTFELAKRIKEETAKGKLKWNSAYSDSYRLSIGLGMVDIIYNQDPQLMPDGSMPSVYQFSVYNDRNEFLDCLFADRESDEYYSFLKEMYNIVRSNYLNQDKTFTSMFDALDLGF